MKQKSKLKTYVLMMADPLKVAGRAITWDPINKIRTGEKIHTIRANADLWVRRIAEVRAARAELSIRTWSGVPYRSKQIEHMRLGADAGVGLEEMRVLNACFASVRTRAQISHAVPMVHLAHNTGLDIDQFLRFIPIKSCHTFAIIHFSKFRYNA